MERKKFLDKCEISDKKGYVQQHHIFRKSARKGRSAKKVEIYWYNSSGNIEKVKIQMNAKVNVCNYIHKLIHPENLKYHLNSLVVKQLKHEVETRADLNNKNYKTVDELIIKVVKPDKLKVGDTILWSKYECKIIAIPDEKGCFCEVLQSFEDKESVVKLPKYLVFYKVIKVVK